MFVIIGIVVVFGCIIAGYLMEHGHMAVLLQPSELVIIGGAALGTVLVANPLIPSVIAGATHPDQVRANVAAGAWRLSPDEVAEVNALAPIAP